MVVQTDAFLRGEVEGGGEGDKQKKFPWHHVNVVIGNPQEMLTTCFQSNCMKSYFFKNISEK